MIFNFTVDKTHDIALVKHNSLKHDSLNLLREVLGILFWAFASKTELIINNPFFKNSWQGAFDRSTLRIGQALFCASDNDLSEL